MILGKPIGVSRDVAWVAPMIACINRAIFGANVTTYGIGSGFSGATSGLLLDQATGTSTGVTATLTQSGGVVWQPDPSTGGADTNVGTDAYRTFHGLADMTA